MPDEPITDVENIDIADIPGTDALCPPLHKEPLTDTDASVHNVEIGDVEAVTVPFSPTQLITRALVSAGSVFLAASAAAFFKLIYDLFRVPIQVPPLIEDPQRQLATLLAAYSVQLVLLAIGALSAVIGYALFRAADTANKEVIPERDYPILQRLIVEEKDRGIDQYIRLSSLIGLTGVFTRLGLVGLPLATIGLTLIFTMLSFWGKEYLDLAKLTLGAFIGSYVQRKASEPT